MNMKVQSAYYELIQIRNHAYNILSGMQFNIKLNEGDKKKLSKLITLIDKKMILDLDNLISSLEEPDNFSLKQEVSDFADKLANAQVIAQKLVTQSLQENDKNLLLEDKKLEDIEEKKVEAAEDKKLEKIKEELKKSPKFRRKQS